MDGRSDNVVLVVDVAGGVCTVEFAFLYNGVLENNEDMVELEKT